MATQVEILLKARDEATKQIQQGFKQAEQSVREFDNTAKNVGNNFNKAGKEVSGFTKYMQEGRQENRMFGFIMREVMDIVGGAALAIKLFGGNTSESEKQAKRLSEAVMAGYIAFQAAETIMSLTTVAINAYRTATVSATVAQEGLAVATETTNLATKANPYILIAQAIIAVGTALYVYSASGEDAIEKTKKLNEEIEKLRGEHNSTIMAIGKLKNELGILNNEGYKKLLKSALQVALVEKMTAEDNYKVAKRQKIDGEERATRDKRLLGLKNDMLKAEQNHLAIKKSIQDFDKQANAEAEANRKKDLEQAIDKNNKLISISKNLQQKTREINSIIGLEGIALKREQLKNEEIALKESLDEQYNGRKQNNELYKQAVIDLNNYIIAKTKELNAEEIKILENSVKAKTDIILQQIEQQIDSENSKRKNYEDSLKSEEQKTIEYFDEIADLYSDEEKKRIILNQKTIALEEIKNKKLKANIQEFLDFTLQGLSIISGFQQQQSEQRYNNIVKERDARLEAIDKQLEDETLSEEARKKLLEERSILETNYENKIKAEKRRAFIAQKDASVVEAIINGILAVSKVWGQTGIGGFALAPIVAAMSAAQVALIASQPIPNFHKGGGAFVNAPANQDVPIMVRGQETIRVTTPNQERKFNGGITINFNSPVSDTQFVANSIKKVLRDTGLSVDSAFKVNRNKLAIG